jgi:hypothetical protein
LRLSFSKLRMAKRPPISIDVQREVLMEAGHMCAIPACRQSPVEIAHIIAWSKTKTHRFENLIALCPTCHTRYDNGEIDQKSMLLYKHRLQVLNRRYSEVENRVLVMLVSRAPDGSILLLEDLEILIVQLLEDGLLEDSGEREAVSSDGRLSRKRYRLTSRGRAYVAQWLSAAGPRQAGMD